MIGAELTKEEKIEDDVRSAVGEMTKGAPAFVRILGKMAAPIISNIAKDSAKMQARLTEQVSEAKLLIMKHEELRRLFGQGFKTSEPTLTESQTVNLNGKMEQSVMFQFQIIGSSGSSGICSMSCKNDEIVRLTVDVDGLQHSIELNPKSLKDGAEGDGKILEADFREKK